MKPTIGIWAGDQNNFQFVEPLIEMMSDDFNVNKYLWDDSDPTNSIESLRMNLEEVDCSWFEWGNGPVVTASNLGIKTPKILRMHRYEIYSDSPFHINFSDIDSIIFSAPSMQQKFYEKFNSDRSIESTTIEMGVDLGRYIHDKRELKKEVLLLGRIHPHKNPSLALQIFASLIQLDSDWKFRVVGKFHDELHEEYFYDASQKLGLENNLEYFGYISDNEKVSLLRNSSFILNTSLIEGISQAILEAMACGAIPVLYDYYGADLVWPSDYLYSRVDQAVDLLLKPTTTMEKSSQFVCNNYNSRDSYLRYRKLLLELI